MKNREYVISRMGTRIDFGNSLGEAVDDLEECLEAYKETRWIPVSDRLPEKDRSVFVFTDCGETDFAYIGHTTGHWFTNGMLLIPNVTHWMPLPEPPEQEV